MERRRAAPLTGPSSQQPPLRRELGLASATLLGLGSILGTGVFVSIGLVAGLAGPWTVVAIVAAAAVATCNALSTAQLAAAYPRSGGTYEYAYELIHPTAGFIAGWMFLCAKSASAATAALGFAGYVQNLAGVTANRTTVWIGALTVIAITGLVASGLRRSTVANAVIVTVTMSALLAFVVAGAPTATARWPTLLDSRPDAPALLEAVALMFVAYAGYGRVATLAEEVRNPRLTIPRAIVVTLGITALLYIAVAAVGVGAVGGDAMFEATEGQAATLAVIAREFARPSLARFVAIGAITAMLGVLLNLILGLSRVALAMGRRGDLPRIVAAIEPRRSTPIVAVALVGGLILVLTVMGSVRTAWSFSAFTVLVYYSLTNLAALRLPLQRRLYARAWSIGGLASCLILAFWVDRPVWIAGLGLIAMGLVWHRVAQSRASR